MLATNVAYSMPGGERSAPSRDRPIDLVHLARQSMGDRSLEVEVLSMFVRQASAIAGQLLHAAPDARRPLAHTLKGSARGVGAFGVADLAGQIEQRPEDLRVVRSLARAVGEVRDFVASINR